MEEQLKEQVKMLFNIMGDPETIKAITNMTWDIFTGLQDKGFSREEALQITIALAAQRGK